MLSNRTHLGGQIAWVGVMDVICIVIGVISGVALRLGSEELNDYIFHHIDGVVVLAGSIIIANYFAGSYRMQHTYSRFNIIVTWMFTIFFAMLVLSLTSYAWFEKMLGRGVLFYSLAIYSVLTLLMKQFFFRWLMASEFLSCRTVIVGSDSGIDDINAMMTSQWVMPAHEVVAIVGIADGGTGKVEFGDFSGTGMARLTSSIDSLPNMVSSLGASLVIVNVNDRLLESRIFSVLRKLRFQGVELMSYLTACEVYNGKVKLALMDEERILESSLISNVPVSRRIKRFLDIFVSLFGLVILSPLFLLVAVCLKIFEAGWPVFYTQARVGQFGDLFKIYKFRTMRPDAEALTGAVWAATDDPRVTKLGRILRKFRLDEMPQLINVLGGSMSIVGPRPERPEIVAKLEKVLPFFSERHNALPGITGWAQIRYPYGNSIEDARRKLEYDLYYIKNLSIGLDIQIILSTIRIVLLGKERAV